MLPVLLPKISTHVLGAEHITNEVLSATSLSLLTSPLLKTAPVLLTIVFIVPLISILPSLLSLTPGWSSSLTYASLPTQTATLHSPCLLIWA